MAASTSLRILDWGRTTYHVAVAQQEALQNARLAEKVGDTLVFTEHEPVFTVGLRSGASAHLVWDATQRAHEGVALAQTNRGGDITYHGPGQLVGYPIVSLGARRDLHAYLRFLEEMLIVSVSNWGLAATRREGLTGIWVGPRKLAAIGVSVRRWVTMHGFALNVAPELRHFEGIVPCGILASQGQVSSLAHELGERAPTLAAAQSVVGQTFATLWPEFLAGRKF
jgi:lipoyl(octanoyl) transferase